MSICHCLLHARRQEEEKKNKELGLFSAIRKGLTYQLSDEDIFHIVDMAQFYKENPELCVSDVTNGNRVQIKVTEYDRDVCRKVRDQSHLDFELFLKYLEISLMSL